MHNALACLVNGGLLATVAYCAQVKQTIDFRRDIAPILEQRCAQCHYAGTSSNNLHLTGRKQLLSTGTVVPGQPKKSFFYNCMVDGWMPPAGKVPESELTLIRDWIAQGAPWPDDVVLK